MKKFECTSTKAVVKALIAALCVATAVSQSSVSAQSLLSLSFPFGLPLQQNSGASFFMGGAANAVAGDYSVMLRNPANLGFIDRTVFSSLFAFQFTQIGEGNSHTNFFKGNPRQVSIGIPMGKFGAIGLSADSRSDADVKFRPTSENFRFDTSSVNYQAGLAATGGLGAWQIGWGREIPELHRLRVGLSYERVYFTFAETIVRTFTDISRTIDSRDSTYKFFGANGLRGGMLLPLWKFKIGLSGEYFFTAKVKQDNAVYSTSSDTVNSSVGTVPVPIDPQNRSVDIRVPPSLTLGVSYAITPEWLVAADVNAVLWGSFSGHGLFPAAARTDAAKSFSTGIQYVPVVALLSPRYLETLRYGAGFRYTELPAAKSSEYAFSLGTGLPVGKGRGEFDIGVEFGRRTSGLYSGYGENFFGLSVGVNGGRKWSKSAAGNY